MTYSHQYQPRILLLLGQGFDDMAVATVIDACGWASYREHSPKVQLDITGVQALSVQGRFGTKLLTTLPPSKICPEQYSAIALPEVFLFNCFQ